MRRYTPKRERLNRAVAAERRAFLEEFPRCWFCGLGLTVSDRSECVHEIASGTGMRPKAISERCTWAAACNYCNCHDMTDRELWPLERQLAVKLVNDPQHFDLVKFNELRGRAPGAITLVDVAEFLEAK